MAGSVHWLSPGPSPGPVGFPAVFQDSDSWISEHGGGMGDLPQQNQGSQDPCNLRGGRASLDTGWN